MSRGEPPDIVSLVVMGTSGCGKTAVSQRLAVDLGWRWADGDDFHAPQAVRAMRAGVPLTEDDRGPWADAIRAWIGDGEKGGRSSVIACSALTQAYRERLAAGLTSVVFCHLLVSENTLRTRMLDRTHFMPVSLLTSQLRTLEPLQDDEKGFAVDGEQSLAAVTAQCRQHLSLFDERRYRPPSLLSDVDDLP